MLRPVATGATGFSRIVSRVDGTSSAISGATVIARIAAGASTAPVKTEAATTARTMGDAHAATLTAAEPAGAAPSAAALRSTATTTSTAASGATRAAYHQSRLIPASLSAPGLPGAGIRRSAPARRPIMATTPARRRAAGVHARV